MLTRAWAMWFAFNARRIAGTVAFALLALAGVGCDLNPQPLPPYAGGGENAGGSVASTGTGSSAGQPTASPPAGGNTGAASSTATPADAAPAANLTATSGSGSSANAGASEVAADAAASDASPEGAPVEVGDAAAEDAQDAPTESSSGDAGLDGPGEDDGPHDAAVDDAPCYEPVDPVDHKCTGAQGDGATRHPHAFADDESAVPL
jgi:hypothetical protein